MIFYDGGKRQRGTLVQKIFNLLERRQGRGGPSSNYPSSKHKQKNKKFITSTKKSERERATKKKQKKTKKKQKKLLDENKNLFSSSSKNSLSLLLSLRGPFRNY